MADPPLARGHDPLVPGTGWARTRHRDGCANWRWSASADLRFGLL